MSAIRLILICMLIVATGGLPACRTGHESPTQTAPQRVLLVCEHGSVKSLMAASYFNRTAANRGLPFRAISRGVTPDASVPGKIAGALARDGFEVSNFKPTQVSSKDLATALRVVAIEVDLSAFAPDTPVSIERWNDVPAASVDYASSRDALQQHVDLLLDQLQSQIRP
jgi:protein-tyrosine-phosphatase